MKTLLIASLPVETDEGIFQAHYSEHGLAGLDFPRMKQLRRAANGAVPAAASRWHPITVRAVKAVLAGKSPDEFPPLDVSCGTEFQQRIWEELLHIHTGETRSYGELAKAVRRPRAVRAVGGACGANPIPLLIPCHRVLAASGRIGGFSGGPEWKRRLLKIEGVTVAG
jgi:O-6-methylguanine DNA methyltransferase